MFVKSTDTVSGFYGSGNTPCDVFIAHCSNGLTWYAVEDGVNVELLSDVDCFTWPSGIDSEETLEEAVES